MIIIEEGTVLLLLNRGLLWDEGTRRLHALVLLCAGQYDPDKYLVKEGIISFSSF